MDKQPLFPQIEAEMLKTWTKEKTFEQSLKQRVGKKYFSFYDGPPFANGLPHYGHVVPSTIKDAIARYKTMQGYYVPRVAGWDTHGLPVEYDVEKQLGLSGKRQILELGVDKFNEVCRASVFRYKGEFEDFIRRLGRFVDLENAYATLNDEYIESVWWVFSEIYKKDLVYKGFRSMPYCPRCATPLSNFELNQGYQDGVEDPSVYVTFPLVNKPDTSFLAWTTTPWTLPANAALAVDEKADYVTVELTKNIESLKKGQKLILAQARLVELELRKTDFKIVNTQKGKELVDSRYVPLYTFTKLTKDEEETVNKVYADKSVSLEDGTGVLHVAPRYGETDLELGLSKRLPLIESVDKFGAMTKEMGDFAGLPFKESDRHIIADLTKKGRIFAAETFAHTYPFCWRCDTPLMYFATPTWNIKVTELIKSLVKNNQSINWVPAHIKKGRFGNWLAEARDWGVSRNRFWGSPLPVWECRDGHYTVVGSLAELKRLAVNYPAKLDLHRPGVDQIKLKCNECGKEATRIEEVFDCWFESGAMPYASVHFPFENEAEFKDGFPADFISEGLDQTRGWFYTLHVLGTALFDSPVYKNVVCHGIVVAADGKKLSKRLRNYPPLEEVFNTYGADILRFFMLNSPVVVGEEVRFSADHLRDTQRNVFMTLWNSFSFFKMYADVDHWKPDGSIQEPSSENILDQWILSRLNQTITEITEQADKYRLDKAVRPIVGLVDDLSNWYIRRSRRRFWKSEDDEDKDYAYKTLHYVLIRICQVLAPWSPFVSDKIYRELTKGMKNQPTSVHLTDWPKAKEPNGKALTDMKIAKDVIEAGLSQRAEAGVKVRQPLQKITVHGPLEQDNLNNENIQNIIKDELNVKEFIFDSKPTDNPVVIDLEITPELKREGLMREVVRQVQELRKQSGLGIADRIHLELGTNDSELAKAIEEHNKTIKQETLATELGSKPANDGKKVNVAGTELMISLTKA